MFLDAEVHTAYEFGNAQVKEFPFPHFYLSNVFPLDFYLRIQESLPKKNDLWPIAEKRPVKGYNERFVCCFDNESLQSLGYEKSLFWTEFRDTFLRGAFGNLLINKFSGAISTRFGGRTDLEFYDELLLVYDVKNYKLGPHTDAPRKVVTVLFYFPQDEEHRSMGTSIYLPKNSAFQCPGGPHYDHADFLKVTTMPYMPNSAFCFFKTNNSFHGVERLSEEGYGRWLLLYDIYARVPEPVKVEDSNSIQKTPFSFSF